MGSRITEEYTGGVARKRPVQLITGVSAACEHLQ